MSRGNQREVDRAKRQAKDASKNQATREGTPMQRNQDDAAKLQAKIAAKAADIGVQLSDAQIQRALAEADGLLEKPCRIDLHLGNADLAEKGRGQACAKRAGQDISCLVN